MRRAIPYLLALVLGVGAALLVACGESTRGGIAAADASDLKSQLDDVRDRVDDGDCDELSGQLRQVDERIDGLPRSVDNRLVESLRDGADRLQRRAVRECNENNAPTQQTVTEEEPVQKQPQTQTQTQPKTQTAPAETTTQPPLTVTEPPPPPVTPPPAVDPAAPPGVGPGGGAQPEVP